MTDQPAAEAAPDGPEGAGDDGFEEMREAAGAVVASLKRLVEAAERVIQDPESFGRLVDDGRDAVEAFVRGFEAQATPGGVDPEGPEGEEPAPES